MLKKVNVIGFKGLYSFIFKVYGPTFIKVSTSDEFQFWTKVQGLKTYLTLRSMHVQRDLIHTIS